jgi:hypothetical protein
MTDQSYTNSVIYYIIYLNAYTMFMPDSLYAPTSLKSLLTARESQLYEYESETALKTMRAPMVHSSAEPKIQLYSGEVRMIADDSR